MRANGFDAGPKLLVAPAERRAPSWLLATAFVLTGLSMRTAVSSVGAVLDSLQTGLHTTSGIAGLVTTVPVVCFAATALVATRLSYRFGSHQLLVVALSLMTAGLVLRAVAGSVWEFMLLSVLALTGGAIANVLLPSLVKRHFPERIGAMTALYTTSMAVGVTAAAGLTVPIGGLAGGWRFGLGGWALLSALAVLPWLPTLQHDRADPEGSRGLPARSLVHSRTTWALTVFFGFQSIQAYVAYGWFPKFFHAHGISTGQAGWLVALYAAMSIPVSIIVPNIAMRHHRALVGVLTACYIAAYLGLTIAPAAGSWVWMMLAGIGSGSFPLALTLIGLRSRAPETTAALSAFTQAIGYLVAGTGPLLFGVLYGATGAWAWPFALLFVATAVMFVAGWYATARRFVDDEVPTPSR